ncbi:hypothetical protein SPONN_1069 [uncultured Candidatus Thioglobus sp.]|nr:hypothetical protein SPONN_1069 [uncultured Candidatus Thioglobus sp.]
MQLSCANLPTNPPPVERYYQDPQWKYPEQAAFIPNSAIKQAQKLTDISAKEFAQFVTKLDLLNVQILQNFEYYNEQVFEQKAKYRLHSVCKIAYLVNP